MYMSDKDSRIYQSYSCVRKKMNKKKMQNILSVDTIIKLKKTNNLNDISN